MVPAVNMHVLPIFFRICRIAEPALSIPDLFEQVDITDVASGSQNVDSTKDT